MTEIYRDSCRACMSKDVPLQGIFQTEVNSVPISAMLTFISSLHIGQNDGLPDMICSTCFNSLLISYEFQQMCVNSDMQMRANLALLQAQSSLSGDGDVEEAPKPSSSNVIEAAEQQHRSYDRDEENQREEDLGNVRAFESTGELVLKSELFDDEEHDGDGSVSGMQVDQAIKDELSSEDESISKPDDAAEETKLSAAKRYSSIKLECEHNTRTFQCKSLQTHELEQFSQEFLSIKDKIAGDNFILQHMTCTNVRRNRPTTGQKNPRSTHTKYFIINTQTQYVPVCLKTFTTVLNIKRHRVNLIAKYYHQYDELPRERRGGIRKGRRFMHRKNINGLYPFEIYANEETNCDSLHDNDHHVYHQLEKRAGKVRTSRKRCIPCYDKIKNEKGATEARMKSKRVSTYCKHCKNMPTMCLDCFNEIHK